MISDQSQNFKVLVTGHCTFFSLGTDSKTHSCIYSLSPVINLLHDSLQNGSSKEGIDQQG